MSGKIDLCGEWSIKGATVYHGAVYDWPRLQPYVPSYPATVPGTVQEALENITGNLYVGHNVQNAAFIEGKYWLYTRSFNVSREQLADKRARLVFEGLDLFAAIYVNGIYIGAHNNFYTPARFDITDKLKEGENRVDVRLDCGLYGTAKNSMEMLSGTPCNAMLRMSWARKPQSSYEWDWAPRLLNVGIFKPCYIEFDSVFVNESAIYHKISKDYSEARLDIRQFLSVYGESERRVRVEVEVAETGDKTAWEEGVKGEAVAKMQLTVKNPRLWYPRGFGEQYRYTVTITVKDVTSGETVKVIEKKVGLRTVAVDQSEREAGGRYFRLLVNGIRVFAKGGNIVPHDILFSKLTYDSYKVLIERAVENNFNALRVWGGGIYESDDFYELCDKYGIVVWQDFIGACATYPGYDKDFLENYISEIRFNIRRMSCYASLVMYCGNNEIEQEVDTTPERMAKYTDANIYYVLLPRVLCEEGDHHYYQPSSPWSPDGENPRGYQSGDQHPWEIGFFDRDYFKYRAMDCRFPNEGGILGPTSLQNMMLALGEGQKYMHSYDFKVHDNSIADYADCAPERMLLEKLGINMEIGGMSIPDYVYYGGFLQGEGLGEYILNFRRRMNDTTSSAIFWMFNDCWPATRSWTTIDYLRNRTPAFWSVKRCFAPVTVDIVKEENGFVFYGINERLEEKCGDLKYGYILPNGEVSFETSRVVLEANNSTPTVCIPFEKMPDGAIPFAELSVDGEPLARRRFVEKPYNELGLSKANIRITHNGDGTVTYLSDKLVLGVCIDLDGDDGTVSDNFFDLYPQTPYTVNVGSKSGEILYCYMG